VQALPFAAIYSTPLLIYVGVIPPSGWFLAIAIQVTWLVIFSAAATLIWRAASRHVVVQGG